MRTAKEIRRYLKQQHWYKEYVRNIANEENKTYCRKFIRGYEGGVSIIGAFRWLRAPQRVEVWVVRNYLFMNWYNRGKKHYEGKKVSSPADGPQSGSRTY